MFPSARYISSYCHGGRIGALVELGTETHMVHAEPEFVALGQDVALQVASMNPQNVEDLLGQSYIRDPTVTVASWLSSVSSSLGERIEVMRFARLDTDEWPTPEPEGPDPKRPAVAARIKSAARG